ncbi:hypothetical protein [Xenorhabdus taiwanensis]|uniref:Transposase n=1 Tax=Xenorhabdus taiwanensis TaxID=3085177 RepID=A0ABN7C4K5_9GAMM|nr:hypothetical protein TCT1_14240 [Xenorhabdus sp. TCT-1]BET97318.1 hypothetical protein TCT1_22390 [Xenorhabdus sp. TCT-1]BET97770.1 hypothetical protein TCT1_26910 [Xenorhabdus sp. TCT-1]
MTDNVVPLKFSKDKKISISTSVTSKTSEQSRCKHLAITVNEQYRTIKCSRCGCYVDAFDYLLAQAYRAEHAVREIQELVKRRDDLRVSCDKLQREEKNIKVRLRGAKTQLQFLENDIKRANDNG